MIHRDLPHALTFLHGGGEMGERIRGFDWSTTPLGAPQTWPGSLRTLVQVLLTSRQPMFIAWGPARTMLYNDGYAPMTAHRHPGALGRPFAEVWADIIDAVGPIMDAAYAGTPTYMDDIEFLMERDGKAVETHFSFGYTPVHDESDQVAGMFCTALEITAEVKEAKTSSAELERLRQLLEQAPSFMAVLSGPEHVFEITNGAYLQLIGHRDVLGKPVRAALPEVAGQGFFELLDGVYSSGKAFVGRALPILLQPEPGAAPEKHFVDLIYQPIVSSEGKITGIFAQGHDITDQKLAEMAAAASEARFRNLAQSLPNHVWTALPDGNLNWFNDQTYAYSGIEQGKLDGQNWVDMMHPDDFAGAGATWATALAQGTTYKTEFRLRRGDGIYRWHLSRATPILSSDGAIEYWVGTNTDIEDQKSAGLALRESEVQLKIALGAAQMGVWEGQVADGRFVGLSGDPRALTMLGVEPGDPSGLDSFAKRLNPEDRAMFNAAATKALDSTGDGILDIECRITAQNHGAERWVHARAQAFEAALGKRLIGTVRDITEVKEAEARQEILSAELQHRIKNTLAMVNAIATQTLRGDDIADRRALFSSRLEALANAHDILTAKTWQGAPMRAVIEGALAPHLSGGNLVAVEGPAVELTPKQALSMALAIHELATNAVKYGALSVPGGSLHIDWTANGLDDLGQAQFRFTWRESGGPLVTEPTRKGFGSRLITRVLAGDFSGQVSIDYDPRGIVCTLSSAAEHVSLRASASANTENALH